MSLTFCDAIKDNPFFFVNNCVFKRKAYSIWPRPAHLSSLWRRHTLSSEGYSVHLHSETGVDRLRIDRKDTHAYPQGTNFNFFRCNCDQELTCLISSNSHRRVKVPAFTYYPLEKRHGRAGRSPCESEIHLSGSGGRVERSRLAFCCCLTLGCITYKQANMKQWGFTSTTSIKYGISFLILFLVRY